MSTLYDRPHWIDPDGETIDPPDCIDTDQIIVYIVRQAQEREAQAEAVARHIAELEERRKRHAAAAERLRAEAIRWMRFKGVERVKRPEMTAYTSRRERVNIAPESVDALPDQYKHVDVKVRADKQAILRDYKAGLFVDENGEMKPPAGCDIIEVETLVIKTK